MKTPIRVLEKKPMKLTEEDYQRFYLNEFQNDEDIMYPVFLEKVDLEFLRMRNEE